MMHLKTKIMLSRRRILFESYILPFQVDSVSPIPAFSILTKNYVYISIFKHKFLKNGKLKIIRIGFKGGHTKNILFSL